MNSLNFDPNIPICHLNVRVEHRSLAVVGPVLVTLVPALLHTFGQRHHRGHLLLPNQTPKVVTG